MRTGFVIASIVVVLSAAVGFAWWVMHGSRAAAPPATPVTAGALSPSERLLASHSIAPPERSEAGIAQPAVDTDRSSISADAKWVDITVVDEAGQPQPTAVVHCSSKELRLPSATEAASMAWSAPVDRHGRTRIAVVADTWVYAYLSDHYGELAISQWEALPVEGVRLVLRADTSLQVQVVDDRGTACENVPVALATTADGAMLEVLDDQRWHTDAAGMAVIPYVGRWLQRLQMAASGNTFGVFVGLPGLANIGAPLKLGNLPSEPVVLQLPACGTVRAHIRCPVTWTMPSWTVDLCDSATEHSCWLTLAPVAGVATFRHVPLGREFIASTNAFGIVSSKFAGPVRAGQIVDVTLEPDADSILLMGRLVDESGRAIDTDGVLLSSPSPLQLRDWQWFATTQDGDFLLALDDVWLRARSLQMELQADAQRGTRIRLDGLTLQPGRNALGVLTMSVGARLCAGRLVAGDAPFTQPMEVQLQRWFAPFDEDSWVDFEAYARFDGAGGFEIYGGIYDGSYRLCFGSEHCLPIEPLPLVPGSADNVVRVTPACTLLLRMQLPESTPSEDLLITLIDELTGKVHKAENHHLDAVSRATTRWRGLPAGSYTMQVGAWAFPPSLTIPGIQLPLPASGDGRLVAIDLRDRLRVVEIASFDQEGEPLTGDDCVFFPSQRTRLDNWLGMLTASSGGTLLVPKGPLDLVATHPGHRPGKVELRGDHLEVRFVPWPEVVVAIDPLPELPRGVDIAVAATAEQETLASWSSPWGNGKLADLLAPSREPQLLRAGSCRLQLGDGPSRLQIYLRSTRNSLVSVPDFTPATLLPTTLQVGVQVSDESWRAALQQLGLR